MKKRAPPPPPSSVSSPSSSSSSSSSSSCVVDYEDHNHNHNHNHIHNQQNDEDEKLPKPKRPRRKRTSINPKVKLPNANANANANADNAPANRRSSIYRGVTRHRWTGKFEAHLWDKNSWNNLQNKKGRQVYLGAYDSEVDAARTYDLAALKYWGPETTLNFGIQNYTKDLQEMQNVSKEEYLSSLRRRSSGFSRGVSKYRGVARHHHNGRWEARIGRVFGNKYLYLGTFSSQEEAAAAYDLAAIEYRGTNAVTNFDISNYIGRVKNLMPTDQLQPPNLSETKPVQQQSQQQQQEPKLQLQKNEDQQQYEQELEQQYLQEVEQQEQMSTMPSKFEEPKLISSIDQSSLLVMDDDRENPWSFCLDNGGYDPLVVPDIPLEEDGRLLDLFDQTGFEDNIDLIFEDILGCQMEIKAFVDLDKKMENSLSFSSSSPSSPASTTSF